MFIERASVKTTRVEGFPATADRPVSLPLRGLQPAGLSLWSTMRSAMGSPNSSGYRWSNRALGDIHSWWPYQLFTCEKADQLSGKCDRYRDLLG